MLKLLAFAPCEKVVTSSEDNSGSLITILQGFSIQAPMPLERSQRVLLPIQWQIFTLWEYSPDDHVYTQRFELESPSGAILLYGEAAVINLDQKDRRFQRNVGKSFGFPIDGDGDYVLRLLLKTDDSDFVELMTFPIPITLSATDSKEGMMVPAFKIQQ